MIVILFVKILFPDPHCPVLCKQDDKVANLNVRLSVRCPGPPSTGTVFVVHSIKCARTQIRKKGTAIDQIEK